MSADGLRDVHTGGRRGSPNNAQRLSSVSCTHRTPAGLLKPSTTGMPGIGELIDGAMQQAAQSGRHFIAAIVDRAPVSRSIVAIDRPKAFERNY